MEASQGTQGRLSSLGHAIEKGDAEGSDTVDVVCTCRKTAIPLQHWVCMAGGLRFTAKLSVFPTGAGACVLLRALEPLEGLETMRQLRNSLRKSTVGRSLKDRELCSGPSKLCQALAIDKSFDQQDLAQDDAVWLEHGPLESSSPAVVVAAARIGIGHAGEWTQKPLRFYVQGSPWVSVVDRVAEQMDQPQQTACSEGLLIVQK